MIGYKNDNTWQKMQSFLPIENRLSEENAPEEYFLNLCGLKIHIDHYKTAKPKARIILFHGVGGNGRLLSFIALPLQKNGFEVICPDLPLYGYTEYAGTITYDTWVKSGTQIVQYYQQQDSLKTFLFGLSAGGMLAYQVTCRCDKISGLITTCILDQRNIEVTKATARHPYFATIGKPLLHTARPVIGNIKIPLKLTANMKAITNDKKLADLLMKDKKSSGVMVPLSFLDTMMEPIIDLEPDQFTLCPFLLAHPKDDHWTNLSLSRIFYDKLGCPKELKMLENSGHFPIEEQGLKQLEEYSLNFLNKLLY